MFIGIAHKVITSHRKGAPNLTLFMTIPTLNALESGELTLHVKNTGYGYANADPISIAVTASDGIEILTEPTINTIPKQSSTELDIPIKALKAGKQSVSVEVTCANYSKSLREEFVVYPPEPELIAEPSVPAFLQVGEDNVVSLKLRNTGMVVAKNIVISVLHPVEIDCISKNEVKIEKIDPGSDREVPFKLNPSVAGQINIGTFKLSFEDLEDETYNKSIEIGTVTARTGPSTSIPTEEVTLAKVEIKRGYEVLQNNDLRFGIRIINNTDSAIMDVETILAYPKTLFSFNDNVVQSLANIDPHGERTAEYILTPLGCIHNEKIDATITYKDHTGEKQAVQMRPKEVHCVCPFLKEKAMREGEFAELANTCEHIQEGLSFSGISVNEITEFVKEACAHRLYVISEHEIDSAKIVNLAGESIGEKAYYLLTAVIQPYNNFTQVALRAYSDKPYGLHGFLNEIGNSIRHLVGSVQSAKEIGIIESKQVINIIDSVVQRTSFGGHGESATSVNIEDSAVQRSEITSARKCPNCGKEVQADERFCSECEVELRTIK